MLQILRDIDDRKQSTLTPSSRQLSSMQETRLRAGHRTRHDGQSLTSGSS